MSPISKRMGVHGREGSGSNNSMSLWTWPWSKSRRLLPRSRQQRLHMNANVNLKYKYAFLTAVLLVCLVAWREETSYNTYYEGYSLMEAMEAATKKNKCCSCINNDDDPNRCLSLAVLVAGSTQRFLFDSFVDHVAGASQKHTNVNSNLNPHPNIKGLGFTHPNIHTNMVDVDYFGILTLKSGPAFRQDAGYMGHLVGRDKIFKGILDPTTTSVHSAAQIQAKMMQRMTSALDIIHHAANPASTNAKVRALRLLTDPIEDDPVLDSIRKKEEKKFRLQQQNKTKTSSSSKSNDEEFDLFAQFPMMDLRPKALNRTKAGNKNMIRLFLALESLYKTEFSNYEAVRGRPYDYVLILRDDTLWLDDFDLHTVIASDPTADAYVLSCDARDPQMMPPEINDHGILIRRSMADVVGKYVSTMVYTDLKACHDSVTEYLGEERGCNSEMILKHIFELNNIRVKLVPQSLLPFERAVLVDGSSTVGAGDGPERPEDVYCYHKFCQSVDQPLELPSKMHKCTALNFTDDQSASDSN